MTTGRGTVTEYEQEPIDAGMARKRSIWLAISGLIVVLLAIFIAQNIEDVPIEFLWFSGDVPLVLIIVIAMLLLNLAIPPLLKYVILSVCTYVVSNLIVSLYRRAVTGIKAMRQPKPSPSAQPQ